MILETEEGQREGERGRGEERERERETLIVCLLYVPQPRIDPTTQACVLTRDQTCKPLVYGTMLQPTEPPSQGPPAFFEDLILLFFPHLPSLSVLHYEAPKSQCGEAVSSWSSGRGEACGEGKSWEHSCISHFCPDSYTEMCNSKK